MAKQLMLIPRNRVEKMLGEQKFRAIQKGKSPVAVKTWIKLRYAPKKGVIK